MLNITACLWFDGKAEEAAAFYTGIFPNSRIGAVHRAAADFPSGKKGDVLTVEFTLDGRPFVGLNGGPMFTFNEAVSFQIFTADQEETDRYWDALLAGGGTPSVCGWLKDRFGLSWQVVPRVLMEGMGSPDREAAGRTMQAMLQMGKIDVAAIKAACAGAGD
ncbi:MAG TPA: VOC family protein [Acetobacteraceae bacterium]|jgi:2-polyprenyl-6-hydroxyphenyl methylase/3-demethylubiquinone-9 3-methyltransferase|nr:VOC family protein [Acetobacteraceae bacterium]